MSNQKLCMACNLEIQDKPCFFFGHQICKDCSETLKLDFYEMNSTQMNQVSNFLRLWAESKASIEARNQRREMRVQRRNLAKFEVSNELEN